MAEKRYTVHVVSETHWDREWHTPFEGFRRRLVKLTDKLLHILDTQPEYKYFVFDGQTVVLEDYLEIRPENREKIARHVQEGRLLIGPWYVLADEWLVSGEALVRNMLLGHLIAESFGRVMKAGYTPDSFGHISQLPQILAGFGINSVFFMRGMDDEHWERVGQKTEFWWQAPSGDKVLTVFLRNTYCNAVNLGWRGDLWADERVVDFDLAREQARAQLESLCPLATTRHILLNNGCDHVEPQPELPQILDHLNGAIDEAEFVHSTYEQVAQAILDEKPDLATTSGEFGGGKFQLLLSGTLSTRMYLKLANERCQVALEKYAEPLQAIGWLEGGRYEQAFLWHAWRHALRNHPHDSICGCSVDQVHRDMMYRFEQAEYLAKLLADEGVRRPAQRLAVWVPEQVQRPELARTIVVFNPSSWPRREVVSVPVSASLAPYQLMPQMAVRDPDGNLVPSQISGSTVKDPNAGYGPAEWSYELAFFAELPPMGLKAYSLLHERVEQPQTDLEADDDRIANEFLEVNVGLDGSVFITDRRDGQEYGPLNVFEDGEDAGDEYDWSPAPCGHTVTSLGQPAVVSLVEKGPARVTLRIDRRFRVPAGLTPDRQRRSEETVELPITTYVSLTPQCPRVDFRTIVDNCAKDHRLRVLFNADVNVDVAYAQGHFDVIERKLEMPPAHGWAQKPLPTKCTKGFVDISDGETGLGVIAFGLPEYEVRESAYGTAVALTLLRCVGWLSRGDGIRGCNAGPNLETPEAQCLGRHEFRYAVVPHAGTWVDAHLWHHSEALRAPLRAWAWPLPESPRQGERELSYLVVEPDTFVVTALKRAERDDALVVRLLNIADVPQQATVAFDRPLVSVHLANLNEEPIEELALQGTQVTVSARQKQLVTLVARFAE
ncbi:MAG: hypothetical protein H5T86_06230 [Armatimonadetes bacterium]|nr:hypothetical protein [Armatimonadota bacterium]